MVIQWIHFQAAAFAFRSLKVMLNFFYPQRLVAKGQTKSQFAAKTFLVHFGGPIERNPKIVKHSNVRL